MDGQEPVVYLAQPRRDPWHVSVSAVKSRRTTGRGHRLLQTESRPDSLLCCNFNWYWADALNRRGEGITHFAMLHDDINPEPGWLETLLRELDMAGADLVSAVAPLKDLRGLSSTAVCDPRTNTVRRLAIAETDKLPVTFDAAQARALFRWQSAVAEDGGDPADDGGGPDWHLLVNTGCWVCRFTEPWVEEFFFEERNEIVRGADGVFRAQCFSEDWLASLRLSCNKLRVLATRAVKLGHRGDFDYPNSGGWGCWETDRHSGEVPADELALALE